MSKLVKIIVELLLLIIKLINLLWRALLWILQVVLRPFRGIFRLLYYHVILPVYRWYLVALKKIGWTKSRNFNPLVALLVNKNFIHVLVVVFALVIVWQNVLASNDAVTSEDVVGKTPLAALVSDELSDDEELIQEYQVENTQTKSNIQPRYQSDLVLNPQIAITTNEPTPNYDELDGELIEGEVPITEDDVTPETPNLPKRTEVIEYVVRDGDTASSIAEQFGISVNTILWENDLSAKGLIKPGDKLSILPFTGVRHKVKRGESLSSIAAYYEVEEQKIAASNNISGSLKSGQDILIPGGRQIIVKSVAGKPKTITKKPKPALGDLSDLPSAKPVYGGKMNWPTSGHTITQYYSWRHNGVDIANKVGTPIYAADGGVIERAEWNSGGYGYMILIDHGNGKKTRYGHLSAFKVSAGATVSKGQLIGAMGSTGRSTGPHLHFEVILSGRRYNPLNYVAY